MDPLPLVHRPTPLEPMPRLTRLAGGPRLWVKRDDCTGLAGGGNKARKLEYLLAEARQRGAQVVVTGGAVQSNHVRQTAAACARWGLACHAVLSRAVPGRGAGYEETGNPLLGRLLGARTEVLAHGETDLAAALDRVVEDYRRRGVPAYLIPVGGSTPTGILGYAACAREIAEQSAAAGFTPAALITAVGTGGTLAGLVLGCGEALPSIRLIGISVGGDHAQQAAQVDDLARAAAGAAATAAGPEWSVEPGYAGGGYGVPSPGGNEAMRTFAEQEGLLLDPVYTAKSGHALLELVRTGGFGPDQDVIYLHTGGLPGLFAYPETVPAVVAVPEPGSEVSRSVQNASREVEERGG